MSQKRGLAVFFGCVIALVVAYAATYPRFHPQPAAVAAASAPVIASAAIALSSGEFPPLPPSSPLSWGRLTPQQHVALAPFASQWDSFSDERKRKWLKIAARFPRMSPEAQKRLQERMTEWVRMTPEQRRVARENYLVSKDLSAQAREKAWKAYQQLSPEQKESSPRPSAGAGRRSSARRPPARPIATSTGSSTRTTAIRRAHPPRASRRPRRARPPRRPCRPRPRRRAPSRRPPRRRPSRLPRRRRSSTVRKRS